MADLNYLIKVEFGGDVSVESSQSDMPKNSAGEKVVQESKAVGINKSLVSSGAAAVMVGKTAFNFVKSNVGTFTGSSYKQEQVNTGMKMIGYAAFAAVNPIGAAAALAVDVGTSAINESIKQTLRRKEIEFNRQKIGFTSFNRSRE